MITRVAVLLLIAFATTVYGAETENGGGIWSSLAEKLEKAPRRKPIISTAVGGVRGARNEASELYWKGKQLPELEQDESDVFRAALDRAIAGDNEGAQRQFENFISRYPNSYLRDDAIKAVAELKKMAKPAASEVKEEVKPDAAPPAKEIAPQAEQKVEPVEPKETK